MANTKSAQFSGSNYLTIPYTNISSGLKFTSDFSISIYVKWVSVTNPRYLVDYWGTSDSNRLGYRVYLTGSTSLGFTIGRTGTLQDDYIWDLSSVITTDTYYHIVLRWDASVAQAELFVDNVSQGTVTRTATSILDPSNTMHIGGARGGALPHVGKIDEASFWSKILSNTEISDLYNSGNGFILTGSETNLEACWRFEDDFLDETANNNDLTNNNSVTFSTDVPFVGEGITYTLSTAKGVFTLTGNVASFLIAHVLAAAKGTFALTGKAASFLRTYVLAAITRAFTLTGNVADLIWSGAATYIITMSNGTFTLTGKVTSIARAITLAAATGTFILTGKATLFIRTYVLQAAKGIFSLIFKEVCMTRPNTWCNIAKNISTFTNKSKNTSTWENLSKH